MGEAADDAIDRCMDEWLSDQYDDEGYYSIRTKTCRDCYAIDLQWGLLAGRWRLFDAAGNLHVCSAKAAFK
jgi:hypothetical protein